MTNYTPLPCSFQSSWGYKDTVMCEWLVVPPTCGDFREGISQSLYRWELPGLFSTTELSSGYSQM